MESVGPGQTRFKDLPPPVLSLIVRAAAGEADFRQLAPVLNLVCRALHEALPDAFSCWNDATGPPAALELSNVFVTQIGYTWPQEAPGAVVPPVLQLSLDKLGNAAFRNRAHSNCLQRTGRRFAHACSLRLLVWKTEGIYASALFFKHVARHLAHVRRLFIIGPQEFPLPPLWQLATFPRLAANVRELCVEGHHTSVSALAAQLSRCLPAATSVCLTLYTDTAEDRNPGLAAKSLVVRAPPQLSALYVSVHALGRDDADERDYESFDFAVTGQPCALKTLCVNTLYDPDVPSFYRSWLLTGPLPALLSLDVTADEISGFPFFPTPGETHPPPALHLTCPQLRTLVLRIDVSNKVLDWASVVGGLELLPSLTRLEVICTQPGWRHDDMAARSEAALLPLAARLLPGVLCSFEVVIDN